MKLYPNGSYREIADDIGAYDTVPWPTPNPKQEGYITSRVTYPAMWGGKGSGKSIALVQRAILLSAESTIHGDMAGNRGFMGRKEWQAFKTTTMRDFFRLLPPAWIKSYSKQDRILVLQNGTEIIFGHLDDISQILSQTLGWIAVDQIEELTMDTWDELTLRHRMTTRLNGKPLDYTSVFSVGNPPGPAHWCYMWEANRLAEGTPQHNPDFLCINTTTYDNEDHLPKGFIERAKRNLTERKFRIFVMGSWEALEGQCFSEFDRERHVLKENRTPHPSWPRFMAIDYGRVAGNAALFMALTPDRKLLFYDEFYNEDAIVDEHVEGIVQAIERHNLDAMEEHIKQGMAYTSRVPVPNMLPETMLYDPAMIRRADLRTEQVDTTIVSLYEESFRMKGYPEVIMSPANNDVMASIDRANFCFKHNLIEINPRCRNTIAQIGTTVTDPRTGKPKAGQKDHCFDTMRYLVLEVFDLVAPESPVKAERTITEQIAAMWRAKGTGEDDAFFGERNFSTSRDYDLLLDRASL